MTLRSSKYLEYIRQQACEVTGADQGVVSHHVRLGFFGAGMKPSDFRCVPLTATKHSQLHHVGEKRFWENHGIDPEQVILRLILVYIAQTGNPDLIPDLERIAEDIASTRTSKEPARKKNPRR